MITHVTVHYCICSIGQFILNFIGIPGVRGEDMVDLDREPVDCIKCKIVQKFLSFSLSCCGHDLKRLFVPFDGLSNTLGQIPSVQVMGRLSFRSPS